MIYICTALPFEAYPFINTLQLKRNLTYNRFSVYQNDDICLIIIGTGTINAAIGLTYLLSSVKIQSYDIVINIGICGSRKKELSIGSPFLIHKIKDNSSYMTYYPEMLYQHPFQEASIETCSKIIDLS